MQSTNGGGDCDAAVFRTPGPRLLDCMRGNAGSARADSRALDELRQQQVALDVIVMLKGMQQAIERRLALARAGEVSD